MSIKPANTQSQTSTIGTYTPATGFAQPQSTTAYATAPYPVTNPPQLIAVDAVTFDTSVALTYVFPAIPVRTSGANPLNPTQANPQTLTINPQDTLIFVGCIQGSINPVSLVLEVLDTNNVVYPAPFLSAGTYKLFRARIAANSPTKGIIVGQLYIQRGGGQ
jgi:hypothetical protein